ncbi:MAG: DUF2007 domain-containing protein [Bacteroidota bacterium]
MAQWRKVFSAEQAYKAEIVKDVLENHGFRPVLINKKDTAYSNFGLHEVHVTSEEVIHALKIIENDINFK